MPATRERKPNILLVMSDQHGHRYTGYGDHPVVQTPNLDRLASESAIFTNAYCPSPLCVPSRMAFMTGRPVQEIEIWDNHTSLPEDTPTWPLWLSRAGYETALSGKMHFKTPERLHYFGAQLATDPSTTKSRSRIIPDWRTGSVPGASLSSLHPLKIDEGSSFATVSDDFSTDRAIRFIREREGCEQPWALCVGLYLPHPPWTVETRYLRLYGEKMVGLPFIPDGYFQGESEVCRRHRAMKRSPRRFPNDQVLAARQGYFGCVTRVDEKVGQLVAALRQTRAWEQTLFVYTSDHGEMLGEKGLWTKSVFYEPSAHIPLLMRLPDGEGKGINRENVSLLDLTATLIDIAGGSASIPVSGRSLLPLLDGNRTWDNVVIGEYYGTWADRPMAMIRRDRYKLIASHGEPSELYDLENDPEEWSDLAVDPCFQAVRAGLESELYVRWNSTDLNKRVLASQDARLNQDTALHSQPKVERDADD